MTEEVEYEIKEESIEEQAARLIKRGIRSLQLGLELAKQNEIEVSIGYDNLEKKQNGEISEGGTFEIGKIQKTIVKDYN